MTQPKPFSPEMLAERWDCSAETVRNLIRRNELPAFRVGKMMRIRADVVGDYECGKLASGDCGEDTASIGAMPTGTEPVFIGGMFLVWTMKSRFDRFSEPRVTS